MSDFGDGRGIQAKLGNRWVYCRSWGASMNASGWVWHRAADVPETLEDNARLRAVLGHCPKGIAVLDEDGNLVGYNAEFGALFSEPPTIGKPVGTLFEERPRAMLAEVVKLAGTKQRAGAILSMRTTVGEEHDFEFLVATLPGDRTRTIGVVMAADDRTARTNDEAERALGARDVGHANVDRAIDLAQAAVCHDINNVLAVLFVTLDSLQEHCGTQDSLACEMIRELRDAVSHGAEVVARSRATSQVVRTHDAPACVRDCVERAVRIVGPLARSSKVVLAVRSDGDSRVRLGETELTQIVTNLLTNSVHAIQDARRPGRIDVTVDAPNAEAVTLSVRDNGVGIEPSRLVDSFEAFETTRAERGGTGLGLAIVRCIVEAAGGHINVLSTPGLATEMRIELPALPYAARIATVA